MLKQKKLIKEKELEENAINFLEEKGYSVIKEDINSINEINNLINNFYIKLKTLYEELDYPEAIIINSKQDSKAITKYLKNCSSLGITRKKSLYNLKLIIDLYFKYYKELELDSPATNLKFLLTNGGWIFDKLRIIYKNIIENYRESEEMEEWRNRLYESEDDIIQKLREKRHKELLQGDRNGKEKTNN